MFAFWIIAGRLWEPYVIQEIEPISTTCKIRILDTVLMLFPLFTYFNLGVITSTSEYISTSV